MSKYVIEAKKVKEVEVVKLDVSAGVRYWEDGTIDGQEDIDGNMPLRKTEFWCPRIDLKTGVIDEWPNGVTAQIHYKVCDAGVYSLLDNEGNTVASIEGYVPRIMSPEDNGYGDYIIMSINGEGKISDWKVTLDEWMD